MVAAVAMEEDVETRVARLESDVAHIRADVADMKVDIRQLKDDLGNLRVEMNKGDASLRDEMHQGFATLERKMIRTSLSDKIWTLLMAAAILGVMAHGFKWL